MSGAIDNLRFCVVAVGVLKMTEEEHRANPLLNKFDVVGSGFLVRPHTVMTCAHVINDPADL